MIMIHDVGTSCLSADTPSRWADLEEEEGREEGRNDVASRQLTGAVGEFSFN